MSDLEIVWVQGQPTEEEMVGLIVALEATQQLTVPHASPLEMESHWRLSALLNRQVSPWLKSTSAWQISGRTSHSWPV